MDKKRIHKRISLTEHEREIIHKYINDQIEEMKRENQSCPITEIHYTKE